MNTVTLEKNKQIITTATTEFSPITWLEIDTKAFAHNIAQYKKVVHPALLAIVVKSNAYGHGIKEIALLADKNDKVDYLCVVSLSEAVFLRINGIKKPILVLSILDDTLEKAFLYNIDLVIYDRQTALELQRIGSSKNQKIKIHLKVDTGLSRLGVALQDAFDFIQQLHHLSFLILEGIFTHFSESEKNDQTFTNYQINHFANLLKKLEQTGINIPLKHSSCSAAATANFNSHFTMARVGIGIYGLWPSEDNQTITEEQHSFFSLKPILTWKTKIILIKDIPQGSFVGYDRTHQVTKNTRLATLPIGYWDGYDRKLSNKSYVIINNQPAPVIGRIAMNLMMVDITNSSASVGDEVLLLGTQKSITVETLAALCNTINYEFVTRINPLLPRLIK